jgi:hypothetical protein
MGDSSVPKRKRPDDLIPVTTREDYKVTIPSMKAPTQWNTYTTNTFTIHCKQVQPSSAVRLCELDIYIASNGVGLCVFEKEQDTAHASSASNQEQSPISAEFLLGCLYSSETILSNRDLFQDIRPVDVFQRDCAAPCIRYTVPFIQGKTICATDLSRAVSNIRVKGTPSEPVFFNHIRFSPTSVFFET